MSSHHVTAGIVLFGLTLAFLAVKVFKAPKRNAVPVHGWAGIAVIVGAEALLFLRVQWVAVYFTPLVWTGYILSVDGLVWALRGESRLERSPRRFFGLAFWSVPLWLIFEAYNFRLRNWAYVGLPHSALATSIGFIWSFATIWPAIHETADLLGALRLFAEESRRRIRFSRPSHVIMVVVGALFLTLPVLVPLQSGRFLFGAVWVGFVLLLDPLNYQWGGRSILRDLEAGRFSVPCSFIAAGWVCGICWEFWNYWAATRWIYVFPIWQSLKIFEMPLPGYLGFLPFALECFVMYEFVRTVREKFLRPAHQAALRSEGSESERAVR